MSRSSCSVNRWCVRIDDANAALVLDVGRGDGAGLVLGDAEDRVLDVFVERQRERLEVADDLVNVFDDARDGLVLVHDAVDAESPDRRAAQRREQHAPHRVAERVAEAALERLETEFCDVGIVFALGGFDQLRTDKPREIDCVCHCSILCSRPNRVRPPRPYAREPVTGSEGPA